MRATHRLCVVLVLLVTGAASSEVHHLAEPDQQPVDPESLDAPDQVAEYPSHSHANAASRSATLKTLSAKKDLLASALRKTDRALERSRSHLKQVHEASRDHLLMHRTAARELEKTQTELSAAEDRLRITDSTLQSAQTRASDLSASTNTEKARLKRVVDDALTRLKRAKKRVAEAAAADEQAKSTRTASVKTAAEAAQAATQKAETLKRKLGAARGSAQSAQLTLSTIQTKTQLRAEADNQRFSEEQQELLNAEGAAKRQLETATARVRDINATVLADRNQVTFLKQDAAVFSKDAANIQTEQSARISKYEAKTQAMVALQKSSAASSQIDNSRVDAAVAKLSLIQRTQQRADSAAAKARKSATHTAQLELHSAAYKQKLANAKRAEVLKTTESGKLLQEWGSLAASSRSAAQVSGQSESEEHEAQQAERAARSAARRSDLKLVQLEKQLKHKKLQVEQAGAAEEQQQGLLEDDNSKEQRSIARTAQHVRSESGRTVSGVEDQLSAARHRLKAASVRALAVDERARQAGDSAESLKAEDARLEIVGRSEERKELAAAEATEKKEEALLETEAKEKIGDSKAASRLKVNEERERQDTARSEATAAKGRLRQAEQLKKEQLDQAQAQQAAEKRETILRTRKMEDLARERAASALEAAQQLSEQHGGSQQEQAARAARLQALAEGATAAAQSSQGDYNDAKAAGDSELKAINEEEKDTVQLAEREEATAQVQADRVLKREEETKTDAAKAITASRREQQQSVRLVEQTLRAQKQKTGGQMKSVQSTTRAAMDTSATIRKVRLQQKQADAAQTAQAATQAHANEDRLSQLVKDKETELRDAQIQARKAVAASEKKAAASRASSAMRLKVSVGSLQESVAQAKREYSMTEHDISVSRDAKHAASETLDQASAQVKSIRSTARFQRRAEDDLNEQAENTKMMMQHTKAEARFAKKQIGLLADKAHEIEKEAVVSKVGSKFEVGQTTAMLQDANDRLQMAQDVLNKVEKDKAANLEKQQETVYLVKKAALKATIVPAAKQKIKVSAEKAHIAALQLVTLNGAVVASERELHTSQLAEKDAIVTVNRTSAKASIFKAEYEEQKNKRNTASKELVSSAENTASVTKEAEAAAQGAFAAGQSRLTAAQDNLESVKEKTMRPFAMASEALKASQEEEQIAHADLLQRDTRLSSFRTASELQESAAAKAVDSAKDTQQQEVAQVNQASLRKADAEQMSGKLTKQSADSHAAEDAAVAEFGELKAASVEKRHQLGLGTEEWSKEEKEHWEASRKRISDQIAAQKEAAIEARTEAVSAAAAAVQAKDDGNKRIEQLKKTHDALRKEFLKQHKDALSRVTAAQKDSMRESAKSTLEARNTQSTAELSHFAAKGRTEQVVTVARARVDRASTRTKKRSAQADQRVEAAELVESQAQVQMEAEREKAILLKEKAADTRQAQEIAEVRQNAAQHALDKARSGIKSLERTEAAKVAVTQKSLDKANELLGHAKSEVGNSTRDLDSAAEQVAAQRLQQYEWDSKVSQQDQLASSSAQSAREEAEITQRTIQQEQNDYQQQQQDEVDSTKDTLAMQLRIVKASNKAKVVQMLQAGHAQVQQAQAASLGKIGLAHNKLLAAEVRTADASGALQDTYGQSLDAKGDEQYYRLKSESALREIDQQADEINEDKQARIDGIEEAYQEQQDETKAEVESIETPEY